VFFVWAIISAAWWWPPLVDVLNNNGPIGPLLEAMQIAFLPLIGLLAFALVCYLAVVGIRGAFRMIVKSAVEEVRKQDDKSE